MIVHRRAQNNSSYVTRSKLIWWDKFTVATLSVGSH